MAVKFDFLSPGVNIREIDNSVLPAETIAAGPILIGRTRRGPAMQPVRVRSYEDFVDVFGAPVLGSAGGNADIWRAGFEQGPQYAALAAQAHLASDTTPITFVRLLGDDNPDVPINTGIKPGWALAGSPNSNASSNSTAYGLFLINSASGPSNAAGCLAAVFYANSGYLSLSGSVLGNVGTGGDGDGTAVTSSAAALIPSNGTNKGFTIGIYDSSEELLEEISFNFDRSDNSKYLRSQFNTNPVISNGDLVSTTKTYWLGETFDRNVADTVTKSATGEVLGIILALENGSSAINWADHQEKFSPAYSGWVFAQDQGSAAAFDPINSQQKLFRFISLHGGDNLQKGTMIGISGIKMPSNTALNNFVSFNVEVMDLNGNILEEFRNVNLNPNSSNYIVKMIGDTKLTWSETEKIYNVLGSEPNRSIYFRVEVDGVVDAGGAQGLAPFGFLGPVRPRDFSLMSGSTVARDALNAGEFAGAFVLGKGSIPQPAGDEAAFASLPVDYTASFKFPQIALRGAGSEGNPVNEYDVYYGIRPMQSSSNSMVDDGYVDYIRKLPVNIDSYTATGDYEYSFAFSLDDLVVATAARTVTYTSGSRASETSYTSVSGAAALVGDDNNITDGVQINQFAMPIWGGFDGLDITEKEPFRNTLLDGGAVTDNYGIYSIMKAVDSIRNSEQVIANSLSIPGITNTKVTDKVISMCEDRKDLLGIIDLVDGYVPATEGKGDAAPKVGNVDNVIRGARSRKLNSSYACTYYPWVQIAANTGVDSGKLWAPPSVAAIGAFASSQRQSELWFAPAGFTRGGLNPLGGVGGPGVVNVDGTLTAKDRDKLYQININPIASFPGEGIVVFGQKTLQATPSALDRINVRRLLIYLKGELSRISRSLLFEPNVNATWLSFKTQADQVLSNVKANFGVTDYKIVLDENTTTADLIDRNILYAKVFIKPTRAIEYIVVDLIVTNTGAEFV